MSSSSVFRSSASAARYSRICAAKIFGSQPSETATSGADFDHGIRPRSPPLLSSCPREEDPSTGIISVGTGTPARSSSRKPASSFGDSRSEVSTRSGLRPLSDARPRSVESATISSALIVPRASAFTRAAWRRSGSMARISGISGTKHEEQQHTAGDHQRDQRSVADALIFQGQHDCVRCAAHVRVD